MHNPYLTSNLATGSVVSVFGSALAEDPDLDVHTGILEATRRRHIAELEAELEAERRRRISEKYKQLLSKPVEIILHVRDMQRTRGPSIMQRTRGPSIRFSTTLCRSDYWRDHLALFWWLVEKVPFDTWGYATVEEHDQRTSRILFSNPHPGSTFLQGSEHVKDECQSLLFGPMLNIQGFDKLYAGAEDSVSASTWLVTIYTQSAELPRIV
jgi:hypothetical protein